MTIPERDQGGTASSSPRDSTLTVAEREQERRRQRDAEATRAREERERARQEEAARRERLRTEEAARRAGTLPLHPTLAVPSVPETHAIPIIPDAVVTDAGLTEARASFARVLARKAERDAARSSVVGVMAAKVSRERSPSPSRDRAPIEQHAWDPRLMWEPLPLVSGQHGESMDGTSSASPIDAIVVRQPARVPETVPLSMARPEVREAVQHAVVEQWLAEREETMSSTGQWLRLVITIAVMIGIVLATIVLLSSG